MEKDLNERNQNPDWYLEEGGGWLTLTDSKEKVFRTEMQIVDSHLSHHETWSKTRVGSNLPKMMPVKKTFCVKELQNFKRPSTALNSLQLFNWVSRAGAIPLKSSKNWSKWTETITKSALLWMFGAEDTNPQGGAHGNCQERCANQVWLFSVQVFRFCCVTGWEKDMLSVLCSTFCMSVQNQRSRRGETSLLETF